METMMKRRTKCLMIALVVALILVFSTSQFTDASRRRSRSKKLPRCRNSINFVWNKQGGTDGRKVTVSITNLYADEQGNNISHDYRKIIHLSKHYPKRTLTLCLQERLFIGAKTELNVWVTKEEWAANGERFEVGQPYFRYEMRGKAINDRRTINIVK